MNEAQRSEESGDEGANLTVLLCAEGRTIRTKWRNLNLIWYCSGVYWYVTAVDKSDNRKKYKDKPKTEYPIGCGETKDLAWTDFYNELRT